jgi:Domain of unknown function (DUF4386)
LSLAHTPDAPDADGVATIPAHPTDPNTTNRGLQAGVRRQLHLAPASSNTATAVVLIVTGCLSLAPFPLLGPSIGWPGSLDNPAADQLSAIGQAPQAVAVGYGVYLLYSLLFLPALGLAAHRLLDGFSRGLVALVVGFAALSALARCIGILRWLTVMPELSVAHAKASAAERADIERLFNALNSYGGGIGELLGVSVFAGSALLLLVAGAAVARSVPGWLTGLGALAAVALLGLFAPSVGLPLQLPIAVPVTLLSLWMWATGGWLLWAARHALAARS